MSHIIDKLFTAKNNFKRRKHRALKTHVTIVDSCTFELVEKIKRIVKNEGNIFVILSSKGD